MASHTTDLNSAPTNPATTPQQNEVPLSQDLELVPFQLEREQVMQLLGDTKHPARLEELPQMVGQFFPQGMEQMTQSQMNKAASAFCAVLRNIHLLPPTKS